MILIVVVAVIVGAVVIRLAVSALRHVRLAAELRGDWWPRFEREFRAYASRSWEDARRAERRA
jgi:hypothetical protein